MVATSQQHAFIGHSYLKPISGRKQMIRKQQATTRDRPGLIDFILGLQNTVF
jgi:hypothetical protein